MLAGLKAKADKVGEAAVARVIARLIADARLPRDVRIDAQQHRIILTGKALRRRRLDDPRLRNFGQ